MTVRSLAPYDAQHAGTSTYADVYTVPDGKTLIVKSVRGFANLAGTYAVAKKNAGGTLLSVPCYTQIAAPGPCTFDPMWVVFDSGEKVALFVETGNLWYVSISGALLDGVAP